MVVNVVGHLVVVVSVDHVFVGDNIRRRRRRCDDGVFGNRGRDLECVPDVVSSSRTQERRPDLRRLQICRRRYFSVGPIQCGIENAC